MSTTEAIPFFTDSAQRKHLLAGETTIIGRAVENDIVSCDIMMVGGEHGQGFAIR